MSIEPAAEKLLTQCLEQEEKYQFNTFSRADACQLGNILAWLGKNAAKPVAAEIKVNGLVLFTYYPEGTSEYYRMVLARKHNTANIMEKSSLRFYAENQVNGLDPAKDMMLDPAKMQFRGGAFPIRMRGGCVIGSIAVAGMAHTEDHGLIIQALEQYFNEKEPNG